MGKLVNNTIILQHLLSSHGMGCVPWVQLTIVRHLEYCKMHSMDFQLMVGDSPESENDTGHWDEVRNIIRFMLMGYDSVIYLDADCIIADVNTDLRDACTSDKIGAVWHDLSYHNPDWSHYNVGALYINNSIITRDFMYRWLSKWPGKPDWPWFDNGEFNILARDCNVIERIDNKWNAGHVSPSDHPVVLGLHGFPDRYEAIKTKMKELEGA